VKKYLTSSGSRQFLQIAHAAQSLQVGGQSIPDDIEHFNQAEGKFQPKDGGALKHLTAAGVQAVYARLD